MHRWGFNKKDRVGPTSEMIREAEPADLEAWVDHYRAHGRSDEELARCLAPGLSHPVRHRSFLRLAAGVTFITPRLREPVPGDIPMHRLLPGVDWRIEPVESVAEGGRLLVRGPNVMKGYLNAEATARFRALDGWYDTGDIASVDEDRFVHIQGRLKRFAKISGEMVSLGAIEDALAGAWPQYGPRCQVAVVARSDGRKGEKLVAVCNEPRLQLAEVRATVQQFFPKCG